MWRSSENKHCEIFRPDDGIHTALVIGAGASAHLEFPIGTSLVDIIVREATDTSSDGFKTLQQMEFSPEIIQEMGDHLNKSAALSIDDFLTDRSEFTDVARAAIAMILIRYERPENLHARVPKNWYRLFRGQIKRAIQENDWGPVVINFNYDRSLDQYLHDMVTSIDPRKANSNSDIITILHVHGRLGYLPHQNQDGFARDYTSSVEPVEILAASECIRVFHELGQNYGVEMEMAQKILQRAKRIIFLGFGFHPTNLFRLRLADTTDDGKWRREHEYHGTAFGLSVDDCGKLHDASGGLIKLGGETQYIHEFMEQFDDWR